MSPAPVELLFIQGAGTGAHEADRVLSEALGRALGPGFRIHFPRMPDERAPDNDVWKRAISTALGRTRATFLVAHSAGAAAAADLLAAGPADASSGLRGVFLLAPPFVGRGGWPLDGFHLDGPIDAVRRRCLPPLHLYFGLDDTTVPPAHADLYAAVFPDATIRRLPGCGHQFEGGLEPVARDLRALAPSRA
ncbi:MAG TPA: alpha/beta hydrolase [Burkholderiaceae bacterium]